MSDGWSEKKFFFIGNHLCLDFINTQVVQHGQAVDRLQGFVDVMAWLVQGGVLDPRTATDRMKTWGSAPETVRALARARELRHMLRHTVERIVAKKSVPQAALIQINELLCNQVGHGELKRVGNGFEKRFVVDFKEPIHLLGPIAESACDLLAYGDLSLIKKCENPACVLVFYDTTKNHSRRWCSMSACGNRMKVAAHYRRLKRPDPA